MPCCILRLVLGAHLKYLQVSLTHRTQHALKLHQYTQQHNRDNATWHFHLPYITN